MPYHRHITPRHALNREIAALSPSDRRQLVEGAREVFGEAAAQRLAMRFGMARGAKPGEDFCNEGGAPAETRARARVAGYKNPLTDLPTDDGE